MQGTSARVFYYIIKLERRDTVERTVLVNELCWEYDLTRNKADEIISSYEKQDKYQELCELVKAKQSISTVIREDV